MRSWMITYSELIFTLSQVVSEATSSNLRTESSNHAEISNRMIGLDKSEWWIKRMFPAGRTDSHKGAENG